MSSPPLTHPFPPPPGFSVQWEASCHRLEVVSVCWGGKKALSSAQLSRSARGTLPAKAPGPAADRSRDRPLSPRAAPFQNASVTVPLMASGWVLLNREHQEEGCLVITTTGAAGTRGRGPGTLQEHSRMHRKSPPQHHQAPCANRAEAEKSALVPKRSASSVAFLSQEVAVSQERCRLENSLIRQGWARAPVSGGRYRTPSPGVHLRKR